MNTTDVPWCSTVPDTGSPVRSTWAGPGGREYRGTAGRPRAENDAGYAATAPDSARAAFVPCVPLLSQRQRQNRTPCVNVTQVVAAGGKWIWSCCY